MPIEGRLLVGTVALGMAGLFGGIGVYLFRRTYKMMTQWNATHGTVVGFKERASSKGGRTYRREVEFQAPSGEKVVFTESTGFGGAPPSIGRQVKVRYSPDDPTQADIPTIVGSWILPLFLLFVGAGCLIMSVVIYAVVP
jgi:hypothetical protein